MRKTTSLIMSLGAGLLLSANAYAQTVTPEGPAQASPAVTISVTERGVRFVGLGSFGQMRLEVFGGDGGTVYNSDFHAGSVRDWALEDKGGQRLADGTYLCLITIRDLSGKLVVKQGSVLLQGGQVSLPMSDGEAGNVEREKALTPITDSANTAVTVVAHDGSNGEVVSTRGALTFRIGDFFGGRDKELMRLTPEGNLGLGVKTPEARLDVAGTIRARQGFVFNDGSTLNVNDRGGLLLTNAGGTVVPNISGTGTQGRLSKWTDNAGTLGDSIVTELNGNLGVGNASPAALVHIGAFGGYGATTGLLLGNNLLGTQFDRALQVAPIQTANPSQNSILIYTLATINAGVTVPKLYGFFIDAKQGPGAVTSYAALATGQQASLGATNNTHLLIGQLTIPTGNYAVYEATGFNNFFAGKVGIGTTTPTAPLDVVGDIKVSGNATISGNIAAKYQDIAEWTPARSELPAGTVVSLDPLKNNSVTAADRAYDTRVAGVVSAKPGVILGEPGPNKVLVATTGRVKVRVNAEGHPIHIGDLLVASNIPGVAMRSQPFRVHGRLMHRPGTIIGKALEPLLKGRGEISVLLSLQ